MKRINKSLIIKILASALALAFVLTSSGCYHSSYYDKYDGDGSFSSISYVRPDFDRFEEVADEVEANSGSFWKALSVFNGYLELNDIINDVYAMEIVADYYSMLDVTDEHIAEEHDLCTNKRLDFYDRLWKITDMLTDAQAGFIVRLFFNLESILEDTFGGPYDEDSDKTQRLIELRKEESELTKRYTLMNSVEYTVNGDDFTYLYEIPDASKTFIDNPDGTRTWAVGIDDVYDMFEGGFIEPDTANNMLMDIFRLTVEDFGEIYISLIEVRNEIAKLEGYDTYAEYAYEEEFERGFKPSDIVALRKSVIPNVLNEYAYYDGMLDYSLEAKADAVGKKIFEDDLVAGSRKVIEAVSDDFTEIIDDMLKRELIDWQYKPEKMDVSFTNFFPIYDIPVIFIQPSESATFNNVCAFFHEFGHFYQMVKCPDSAYANDLDSAEVLSQALELLCTKYYGLLLDDDEVCEYEYNKAMSNICYSMLQAFIIDEFESAVYVAEDLTPAGITKLYGDILVKYGLLENDEYFDFTAAQWASIYHIFAYPFYYISYGVSAIAALEIYESDDSFEVYKAFCDGSAELSLRENCRENGLGDPLESETVINTLNNISKKK